MTTRHANSQRTLTIHDFEHPWYARNYRADLANSKPSPNEDPQGELAYQRAFAVAAQQNPPRVPNPDFYPHSPSASTTINSRAEAVFCVRKSAALPSPPASSSSPQSQYEPHPSPRLDKRYSSHKPNLSIKLEQTPFDPPNHSHPFSPAPVKPSEDPAPPARRLPMILEPKMHAPRGPDNPLR